MKIFAISDTHFCHANIIKYCNRPFSCVEEMNESLIKNWNEAVSNDDVVLHLGDYCLGSKEAARDITSRLHGKKILIMGNHDNWNESFYREIGFHTVSRFPILYDNYYLLSHAPLVLSESTPYGNIYGHVHNDERYRDTSNTMCVSVERTGYRPVMLFER